MLQMTRIAVLLPAVLMVVSSCATRDWVRGLMGKKEAEIGERMDGLGGQIKTIKTNLGETTRLARDAGERAGGAMAKAGGVDSRLTRLWSNRYNQKTVDTVRDLLRLRACRALRRRPDRPPQRGQGAGGEARRSWSSSAA